MKVKVIFCLIATLQLIGSSSIAKESLSVEAAPNKDDEFFNSLMEDFNLAENILTEPPSTTEQPDFNTLSSEASTEHEISSGETQYVEIQNGSFFRLKLTVIEEWTDEFLDKSSEKFINLANNLGTELIDLIDNSNESLEPNMTTFKLIEVLPSKNSKARIYVTFIVTSTVEMNGEHLKNVISNRTLMNGAIYDISVSHEGFCMENISEETAKREENDDVKGSICESDDFSVTSATDHSEFEDTLSHPSVELIDEVKDFRKDRCSRETIERGKTAIYIFEDNQQCVENVRNKIDGGHNDLHDVELLNEEAKEMSKNRDCKKSGKSIKRSTDESEDEETIIVVKRKGSKIFIEM